MGLEMTRKCYQDIQNGLREAYSTVRIAAVFLDHLTQTKTLTLPSSAGFIAYLTVEYIVLYFQDSIVVYGLYSITSKMS